MRTLTFLLVLTIGVVVAVRAGELSPPLEVESELSPQALVREVLARNPTLAQMEAAREAAEARVPQSGALDDPMLGLTVAPGSVGNNTVDFGGRIEVSQKYPGPGKRKLRTCGAVAEAQAAAEDVADARLRLVESAYAALADYYQADRQRVVNQEGLALLAEMRKNAEARYRTGQATQQDVLQADVETGRQREQALALERTRRVAVARINQLMHRPPTTPLPLPPREVQSVDGTPSADALRAAALAQRPDLRALHQRVAVEEAAVALAHKEFCPDFEVVGAYDSMMGNGPTRPVAGQVGVRLNLPVRTGRRYAALAEAEARLRQRRAELESRQAEVEFQVQEAYEQLAESEQAIQLYQKTILPAAQDNIRAAQSAYLTGKSPFVALIEAQRALVELRDRLAMTQADWLRRRATLDRAVGGPLDH